MLCGILAALPCSAEGKADTKAAQALLSPDETLAVLEVPLGQKKTIDKGVIKGYKSDAYAVAVPAGATLHVEMKTKSTSAYFNVHDVKDQSGAAVHRGEYDSAVASIQAEQPGTYLIRPFLVRAVARRGSTAEYSIAVSVEQAGGATAKEAGETGIRKERVQFEKGESGATIKGQVKGEEVVDYVLGAKMGQIMVALLTSENTDLYFNVTAPGEDSALFIGSTSGNRFEGELPKNGEYVIRVYLMGPAAKRGENAAYTLDIGIAGPAASGQPAGEANPTDPYTTAEFDATTLFRCEIRKTADMTKPVTHNQTCPAGIRRGEGGVAEIRIMKPDGVERVLSYKKDNWTTDRGTLTSGKEGDSWYIGIDDCEFYIVPEAAVYGG